MKNDIFFDVPGLAQRWHISPRTLERWRWLGIGPQFMKIGARVLYRVTDIESYESRSIHQSTVKEDNTSIDAAA
jgi:hypothetical protein